MNYATTARRPNPLAAIGALGVPASFGAILVIGLAVNVVVAPPVPNPVATNTPSVVITPEPIEPDKPNVTQPQTRQAPHMDPPIPRPAPTTGPIILTTSGPLTGPGTFDEGLGSGTGLIELTPIPPAPPAFDPVKASPRGSPGNWISTADYRSSWIRRGFEGKARFTLEISERGKVTSCTITGSTGHEALDRATCQLVQSRAVFNPAKDSTGEKVTGRYSSAVTWRIPE